MPFLELQWVQLSLKPYDEAPGLERVPLTWLGDALEEVGQRLADPQAYCPATVLGHWGQNNLAVVVRHMPCIEQVRAKGEWCWRHKEIAPPAPPELPPTHPIHRLRQVFKSTTPAPNPLPVPPPPPPPPPLKPAPTPMAHCQDCRDLYVVGSGRKAWPGCCWRCGGVRETARKQANRAPPAPKPTWRCKMCRAAIPTTNSLRLCQACIDSHTGKDVEVDDDGVGVGKGQELPGQVTSYRNRRGEWVVFGRVQKHSRYGESRADRFGD